MGTAVSPLAWLVDPAVQGGLHGFGALVLGAAALHKLREPAAFRTALAGYDLLPAAWAPTAARLLAWGEAALAVALLLPGTGPLPALAAAGLLALYSAAVTWNLARGRAQIDCGCGGAGGERPLGADLVLRNAALAGALLAAALPAAPRTAVWLDVVTALGVAFGLALAHAAFDVALANAARLRTRRGPAWATH